MAKRKKRLIKQQEGLLRQAEKHRLKVETEKGRKDTTHEYWKKEISKFERRALSDIKNAVNQLKDFAKNVKIKFQKYFPKSKRRR